MKSLVLKKTETSLIEAEVGEHSGGKFLQVEIEQEVCNDRGFAREYSSLTLDKQAALKLAELIINNFKED